MCVSVRQRSLGRCVSSLKNLFFMLVNWWLEWCEGGWGGGGSLSLSLSSSSAALRIRAPAALTNRIAALMKSKESRQQQVSNFGISKSTLQTLKPFPKLWTPGAHNILNLSSDVPFFKTWSYATFHSALISLIFISLISLSCLAPFIHPLVSGISQRRTNYSHQGQDMLLFFTKVILENNTHVVKFHWWRKYTHILYLNNSNPTKLF